MRISRSCWGKGATDESVRKPQISKRSDTNRPRQGLQKVRSRLAGLPVLLFLSLAFWFPQPLAPDALAAAGNATGNPVIVRGSLAPGLYVGVNRSDIRDRDGIDARTVEHTWLRCDASGEVCTEIQTSPAYEITWADHGSRLKARVDFLDKDGNLESLTTPLCPPLHEGTIGANATGAPRISGQAQIGLTITGSTGNVRDSDGIDGSTLSYSWLRCLADGRYCTTEIATGDGYTLTGADVGTRLQLRLRFSDNDGITEIRTSGAWPGSRFVGAAPVTTVREVFHDRLDLTFHEDLKLDAVPPTGAFGVARDVLRGPPPRERK